MTMNYLLKQKNKILISSVILVVLSILAISTLGFRLGIDFTSGSLWQVRIADTSDVEVREFFNDELGIDEINISFDSANNIYALTLREITEVERQDLLGKLDNKFSGVESLEFATISPSISEELRQKAILAVGFVLVGISLYIAFAFRKVSEPIRSWKYGIITLITLFHDVAIPAGIFAILGKTNGIGIDTNFIVAMLFVMGFSVHDTIVVFDRVKENLMEKQEGKQKIDLEEIVDRSILGTVVRSINTSLTLIVILIALIFLGPISTKMFVLAILIGTIAGTYSSIFFASPLLLLAQRYTSNTHK